MSNATTLLVGDIGGTNARFALARIDKPAYEHELTLQCAEFESAEAAINAYLEKVSASRPAVICLAVAGPVVDGTVSFTNNRWQVATTGLSAIFNTSLVRLLNDFEAIACSIPEVNRRYSLQLSGPEEQDLSNGDFSVGILGPGTGLGAAGLLRRGSQLIPMATEAGHVGFAPESAIQDELLQQLRAKYSRVSDERLVSGMGIENLYWALSSLEHGKGIEINAAQVFERMNQDPVASRVVDLFFELLGQVAGNLALSLGAFNGVYIAGGIAQRYPELLQASRFREGFENKGRHRALLERVPTMLVQHPNPGLLGAASVAIDMLKERR